MDYDVVMSAATFVRDDAAARAALVAISADEVEHARWYARTMRHRAVLDAALNGTGTQHGTVELAGTARIGQGRAATQCADARRLLEVFSETLTLLEAGRVFVHTVELMLSMTRQCTETVQHEVERRVLGQVVDCTTTDVRRILERTIPEVEADLDPVLTEQRLAAARRQRGVWVRPVADGMVQVGATLQAVLGRRFELDLGVLVTAQRASDRAAGTDRSMAQAQADVFAELPTRHLALLHAIRSGRAEELRALAVAPGGSAQVDAVADTLDALDQLEADTLDQLNDLASTADAGSAASDDITVDDVSAYMPQGSDAPGPSSTPEDQEAVDPVLDPLDPEDLWGLVDVPLDRFGRPQAWTEAEWQALMEQGPPDSAWTQQPPPPVGDPSGLGPADLTGQSDRLQDLTLHELAMELLRLPVNQPVTVNVHVPMSTLLEVDHRAGYLEGIGAIPAQHCRLLAVTGSLRRLYVNPTSGVPLGTDQHALEPLISPDQLTLSTEEQRAELSAQTRLRLLGLLGPAGIADRAEPQHDPSAALARQVDTRDQRCTGIGCNRGHCERDHQVAHPTGPTAVWNLDLKSIRCHHLKHEGWTVTTDQHGRHHWTSPLGHTYHRPGVWSAPTRLPDDGTAPLELSDPTPLRLPKETVDLGPRLELPSYRKARQHAEARVTAQARDGAEPTSQTQQPDQPE